MPLGALIPPFLLLEIVLDDKLAVAFKQLLLLAKIQLSSGRHTEFLYAP